MDERLDHCRIVKRTVVVSCDLDNTPHLAVLLIRWYDPASTNGWITMRLTRL